MNLENSTYDKLPPNAIEIFGGQGFVARINENCAGDDLMVVNAARVSFGRRSNEFTKSDEELLRYMAKNGHMSPFRHPQICFHLKAPEMMMRQAYKHVVGIDWTSSTPPIKDHAWNEISGRYVMYDDVYKPTQFRPQSETNKQGSEDGDLRDRHVGRLEEEPGGIDAMLYERGIVDEPPTVEELYDIALEVTKWCYVSMAKAGVAREQARLVMPFATFTEVIWTCSLEAVAHFVALRDHPHAQSEIREFAQAVATLTKERFPKSFEVLTS